MGTLEKDQYHCANFGNDYKGKNYDGDGELQNDDYKNYHNHRRFGNDCKDIGKAASTTTWKTMMAMTDS